MKYYTEEQVEKLLETQLGNCYVAILNETKDERLAKVAGNAPEPGGNWRSMNQSKFKKEIEEPIEEVLEIAVELSKLLDDQISDLYQVKGGATTRHSYMFYRDHVWDIIETLKTIKKIR